MPYIQLDTYSAFSFLESTITPKRIAEQAAALGYDSLALADHNVLHGVIPFYKECRKRGIKPIIGLTADVLADEETKRSHPFIFLAKSYAGYQNLMKISSAVQIYSPSSLTLKRLEKYRKDLFVISPGIEGEIAQLILADKEDIAKERADFYRSFFEEDSFFLSIYIGRNVKLKKAAEKMINIGRELQIPFIAQSPVRFLQADDHRAWKCLEAIKKNVLLEELPNEELEEDFYLKSPEEMKARFHNYPDAIKNLERIKNECNVEFIFHQQLLPKFPLPEGNADDYLTMLCEKGLLKRIPNHTDEYKKRLKYELSIITKMKFSDYFLIVWDYVRYAKENGIIVGPGRGSAAGSLVAYVLGITEVDPIQYNLLFERFLNPERVSMPDIDIDFPDHRRDEMIAYVAQKYGKDHVAQIITFGTFAAKAALRDAARVYGLTNKELGQFSRAVPGRPGMTLDAALKESNELKSLLRNEKYREIFQIARKIEGLPRHSSTHAAGVIISDRPLIEMIPLQQSSGDVFLTQYPMGTLEELGLLKMDFLGLRNLSLMEEILREIRKKEGVRLQLDSIPENDELTFRLLQEGKTTGVFQLESEGMKNVLKQLKPTKFEDIVAVIALYRPGPMSNIPHYINRKHGKEPVVYPHPDLEPILKNTYGVIVYQEQIMQIAASMAGFSLGEADLLRRAVSKKKRETLDEEREHFVKGSVKKGYSKEAADSIYDLIVRFADYGFNRSHAAAYSVIAYRLAYLKAHYPLYFMAALLTSVVGNEDKIEEYCKELRLLGYSIKKPSINYSSYRFQAEKDGIRFSLAAIKGVGLQALKEIIRARKNRPYQDLFDFCIRVSHKTVNRKTIENLIHSGSFDEFGYDRATLLATLDAAIEHAQLMKPADGQMELLSSDGMSFQPKYTVVDPIPIDIKLQYEKQVLGMFLSTHPASLYRKVFYYYKAKFLDEIAGGQKGAKVVVYITEDKKIRTKNGEAMSFLTISDETGELSAVVFPNVYRRFGNLLKRGETVLLSGYMEIRRDRLQYVVQEAESAAKAADLIANARLFIRITPSEQKQGTLVQVKKVLESFKGDIPVIIYYEAEQKSIQLSRKYWVDIQSDGIIKLRGLLGGENVVLQ